MYLKVGARVTVSEDTGMSLNYSLTGFSSGHVRNKTPSS